MKAVHPGTHGKIIYMDNKCGKSLLNLHYKRLAACRRKHHTNITTIYFEWEHLPIYLSGRHRPLETSPAKIRFVLNILD